MKSKRVGMLFIASSEWRLDGTWNVRDVVQRECYLTAFVKDHTSLYHEESLFD